MENLNSVTRQAEDILSTKKWFATFNRQTYNGKCIVEEPYIDVDETLA